MSSHSLEGSKWLTDLWLYQCFSSMHTLLSIYLFSLSLRYTFVKVLPGNYDITAAHPSWTLEKVSVLTSVFSGVSSVNVPEVYHLFYLLCVLYLSFM